MRKEKEMFDLILGIAQQDERIRAVYMNGSRTNPDVPKDMFQDYDIVYVVTETASFRKDAQWIKHFGDLIMIQEPDKNDQAVGIEMDFDRSYTYLMLFTDGNRIDLHVETKEAMLAEYGTDKLTMPLLDKDDCLPVIPAATDVDYHVKKPTEPEFINGCNEFWWCLQNVAKGIWRDELPYAKRMFEATSRAELEEMVAWWIGTKHDFRVSVGKLGKYYQRYLLAAHWELYKKTYADSSYDNMWAALFAACELFRVLGQEVGESLGYPYPSEDDARMLAYLKQVRNLPADAKNIYG